MRVKNVWLLSVLVVLLFSVACGPDDADDKNNVNNKQDTGIVDTDAGNTGTDVKDEPVAEPWKDADVLANGKNKTPDDAVKFEVGQSVGGALKTSVGGEEDYDMHYYQVELRAGTVVELEFTVLGDGFNTAEGKTALAGLMDDQGVIERYLVSSEGMKRQVFVPVTGTYYVAVYDERAGQEAHGGSQSYYKLTTSVVDLAVEDFPASGEFAGDLNDGKVRAFKMIAGEDGVAIAQAFGWDPEGENFLDPALFAWDPTAKKLLGNNEDIDADSGDYDAELVFQVKKNGTYWVVLDSYDNSKPAEFELVVSITDDHPYFPGILTFGEESSGTISAAKDGVVDLDYFVVEIAGGQTLRVEVTGDDALQPSIQIYDDYGFPVNLALSVGKRAAIEFAHPMDDEDEPAEYFVVIGDQRNNIVKKGDVSANVGGPTFGYKVKATVGSVNAVDSTLPVNADITLPDVGTTLWYEVSIPANHIVQLEVTTAASNFLPYLAMIHPEGYDWSIPSPIAYISGAEATKEIFGVRDQYFRGGVGYDAAVKMNAYDLGGITYTPVADIATNVSVATAQAVTLPVEISGVMAGESATKLGADYFTVSLVAGTKLIVRAGSPAKADMHVRLLKPDGTTLAIENDFYLGQEGTFFSAFVYDVTVAGDYTLEIAPYCDEIKDKKCAGNGDYTLNAFVVGL